MIHSNRYRRNSRDGVAAVEFAFVAPIVFFLTFAGFEFMYVTMLQSAADVAAYEAARTVMVPGSKIDEALEETSKYLDYLCGDNKTVTVTPRGADDSVQSEIDDFTASVTVDVQIPVPQTTLLLSRFFGGKTIHSHATLSFESYSGFYDGSAY